MVSFGWVLRGVKFEFWNRKEEIMFFFAEGRDYVLNVLIYGRISNLNWKSKCQSGS